MYQSTIEGLFYYHIGQQCMVHCLPYKDEAYFKAMAQEASDFLKGQDDKIIDDLQGKMNAAAQSMNLSVRGLNTVI